MSHRKLFAAAVGTALIGATLLAAPVASAGNVGWSVSIGGPGYAVTAGEPFYGSPYRPYYRPYYQRYYQPVVVEPPVYFAPPVVYRPYYRPYRVYAPAPAYYRPAPVVYGGHHGYGYRN